MVLTLDDLYASPDHFLHAFDGDAALLVPMDRAAYHRSIFLDARISPRMDGSMRLPVAMLARAVPKPLPTGWIFHMAHCGSTLLARALDDPAGAIVLREPLALRQVAVAPDVDRLSVVTAMLGKRYWPDAPTIVKANVPVNFLLPKLAARDADARTLFLYLPLRDYLLAILRSDQHRAWLRRVTVQLAAWLGDLSGLPDAERAAALWLAQMRAHATAIAAMPNARSLDAELFFAMPRPVLAAVAAHLDVPLQQSAIDARVAGPLFATYSKNPAVPFGNADRQARRRQAEVVLAEEIMQAERWLEAHAGTAEAATAAVAAVGVTG